MANVIESLLVSLGLDTKEYEKGVKKAEKSTDALAKKEKDAKKKNSDQDKKDAKERDKHQKEREKQNKQTIDGLNKIRNQILGVMTVFAAGQGIMSFAKSTIFGASAIGRFAENSGMAVSEVAGLGQALERIGGSSEEAQGTIESLSEEMSKYKMGMESAITEYIRWQGGISHGELDTTKNLILGMADAFQKMNEQNPADALMKAHRMGISTNMFNLLKQGRAAVQGQIADGAKLTGINEKQVAVAQKAQKAWADSAARLASVGRSILIPILNAISKWMDKHKDDIGRWLEKLQNTISEFTPEALEGVGRAFDRIYETVIAIGDTVSQLKDFGIRMGIIRSDEEQKKWEEKNKADPVRKALFSKGIPGSVDVMNAVSAYISNRGGGSKSSTTTSNVHVGQINVTGASDPRGSAKAVEGALQNFSGLATQANTGQW